MEKLIQIGYAAFQNGNLGEISDTTDDQRIPIFSIRSELDIKTAKDKRDAKRRQEQQQYDDAMGKIRTMKESTFNEGITLENARELLRDFKYQLDDWIIENE
ncbi:MAG: hypothetical protein EZS28_001373 [Streblomastix strix]|uniref:Uncharacterized protein n=1 Tax=Streblomastix strix TaxID=222440 RepID=A0A5J4X934_9EUKA|nr:MAG: hypothetical protein EZS28_001373 [Streblomastix strix]